MKKHAIFSLFVAVSSLVASCSGFGGNPTPMPGTFFEPQATETRADTMAVEIPTPSVFTTTPQGTPGIPSTGGRLSDDYRLSSLLHFKVRDDQGKELGAVRDMILNMNSPIIQYVVVGSGGFLGIGQKDLVAPFSLFRLDPKNQEKMLVYLAGTEELKTAPVIDLTSIDLNQAEWDQPLARYWSDAVASVSGTPEGTATPMTTGTAILKRTATKPAPTKTAKAAATEAPGSRPVHTFLASKLLGARVTGMAAVPQGTGTVKAKTAIPLARTQTAVGANPAKPTAGLAPGVKGIGLPYTGMSGEDFGGAEDAIIDPGTGQLQYVVITASSALNIGDKIVTVPLGRLLIVSEGNQSAPENVVVVVTDIVRLRNAPNFERTSPPDVTRPGWDAKIRGYWFPRNLNP